jgi:hypothetical protein
MNIGPAWYKQEDAVEAGSLTVDTVPPITGRESRAVHAAGVTKLQELGAAARATIAALIWRRTSTEITTRCGLHLIDTETLFLRAIARQIIRKFKCPLRGRHILLANVSSWLRIQPICAGSAARERPIGGEPHEFPLLIHMQRWRLLSGSKKG